MLSQSNNKNKDKSGSSTEDHLTTHTGGLVAKTDILNEFPYLLNRVDPVKMDCVKKSNNDLEKSDNSLLMANEEISKTSDSFAKVNEELAASSKEVKLIREQVKYHSMRQREFIQNASNELRSSIRSTLESL